MSQLQNSKGLVFLLHGMFTPDDMSGLKQDFEEGSYNTYQYRYIPRKEGNMHNIVSRFREEFRTAAQAYLDKNPDGKIHFVTHSYGGRILAEFAKREAKAAENNEQIKRLYDQIDSAVMFAPPLSGSPVADFWRHSLLYPLRPLSRLIAGDLNEELATKSNKGDNFPAQPPFPTGIIAGDTPTDLTDARLIKRLKLWPANVGLDLAGYKGKHDSLVPLDSANPNHDETNPRWGDWSASDNFRVVAMGHDEIIEKGNPIPAILHFFKHKNFNGAPLPKFGNSI